MASNTSSRKRRVPPFWVRRGSAPPAVRAAVSAHIESQRDALRWRDLNVRSLCSSMLFAALATAISDCTFEKPCRQVLCPICARRYRLWQTSETLAVISSDVPAFVATILLKAISGHELAPVSLDTLHNRLRKKLLRCGCRAAIGGTEFAYQAGDDRWIAHVHLLVLGDIDMVRPKLKEAFRNSGIERAVKCTTLRDRVEQISYLQKFATYHRPGSTRSAGKARAYPLKAAQIAQLGLMTEDKRFEDFLFLLSFRRRGAKIVAEPRTAKLLNRALSKRQQNHGDAGDSGDALERGKALPVRQPRGTTCSVTTSPTKTAQQYRDPSSKLTDHEDKHRGAAQRARQSDVATVKGPARRR